MKNINSALLLLFIFACSSPQKSLEDKNYGKAYKSSLRDLGKKKPNLNSKEVLIFALRELIKEEKSYLESLKLVDSAAKKKDGLQVISKLQHKIERAQEYINDEFILEYLDLEKEEELFTFQLSNIYVQEGLQELETYHLTNNKYAARRAYQCFEKSEKYLPFTDELDSLSQNSFELAQLIYTINVNTLWNNFNSFKMSNTFDDLARNGGKFIKVYSGSYQNKEEVDCNIEVSFSSLDIETNEKESTEDFSKEIITTETTTNDDGEEVEVEVSNTVTAKVITIETIKTAEWDVTISVNGTENCSVKSTRFSEELISKIEEEKYEGDERALPSKKKSRFTEKLMSDSDMVEELLETIYGKVEGHIF